MKILKNLELPEKMKALILTKFGGKLVIEELKVPTPGDSEILIMMDNSPINPSDNSFLKGMYGSKKSLPIIPGFEGSGKVIASGSSFMSKRLLGKNVACFAPMDGNGTWAEYMVTNASMAIPLKKEVDLEQGAMLMVNPLSIMAMLDISKKGKHKAIANTAAASALGQMLNRLCLDKNLPIVNIVRRDEQAELLKSQGAEYILNSSEGNYKEKLSEIFSNLNVSLVFDAIAGQSTSDLIDALPIGGEVMVYGGLSEQPSTINPGKLIFEKKKITGFWLSDWITHQSMLKLLRTFNKIQKVISKEHQTKIQRRVSLEETQDGIKEYLENMTSGKVLVKPNMK
jgi:NADPH2:quinone reductase